MVPSLAFGDLVGGEDLMPEPATEDVVVVVIAPPARVLLCSVVVWTSTQVAISYLQYHTAVGLVRHAI